MPADGRVVQVLPLVVEGVVLHVGGVGAALQTQGGSTQNAAMAAIPALRASVERMRPVGPGQLRWEHCAARAAIQVPPQPASQRPQRERVTTRPSRSLNLYCKASERLPGRSSRDRGRSTPRCWPG